MREVATWIVQLMIDGPVSVRRAIRFQHPKGFNSRRQFYSDIEIGNSPYGLKMSVTAFARDREVARKAALVFVGEALDVLSTSLNSRLTLSLDDQHQVTKSRHSVKRIITDAEAKQAFSRARWLSEHEPTFLRALSWFRKALETDNPLDRFFALWLAIEIVAGKYHPDVPRVRNGSISQTWESFKILWGECPDWPLISNQTDWIDQNHDLRVQIAHGTAAVDIDAVERAAEMAKVIEGVSQRFLTDWEHRNFAPRYPLE